MPLLIISQNVVKPVQITTSDLLTLSVMFSGHGQQNKNTMAADNCRRALWYRNVITARTAAPPSHQYIFNYTAM